MLIIRKAKKEDSENIIDVNIKTWLDTYKGIVADEFLKNKINTRQISIDKCRNTVEKDNNVYVAILDNKLVGIVSFGKSKIDKYYKYGEIYSLYVLKDYQRRGIGKAIFFNGINDLKEQQYKNILVSCIKQNPSNEFYIKMGGKKIGEKTSLFGKQLIQENIFEFKI